MKKTPLAVCGTCGLLACGLLFWARPLTGQLASSATPADRTATTSPDPQQQAKIKAIMKRIHAGDWSAVEDVPAQLDRSVGVDLLTKLVMSQTTEDEPHRQAAGRALAKLGVENEFGAQIARASHDMAQLSGGYYAGIQDRTRAFQALQYIRTNRAVAVLASFLSDETMPAQVDADVVQEPTCLLAAFALTSLGLADAPTQKNAGVYMEDVEKWRQWWSEHRPQFEHE